MEGNGQLIRNIKVYGENRVIERGFIHVKNGKIVAVGEESEWNERELQNAKEIRLRGGAICIPGFIDVHIHGAAGADVMDATPDALNRMARSLPAEGTTSFLATTMTQENEAIESALKNAAAFKEGQPDAGASEMLGIHLEGPFISLEKAGAQPVQHIKDPEITLFEKWQRASLGNIRIVTVAPESKGALTFIRHLVAKDVVASIGHSNASYEEAEAGVKAGATHITHLFNGMSGVHHREPGVAGAALLLNELTAELIVDGFHSRPEMVDLAFRMKSDEGLILITDAMRAKCLKSGTYDLGGQNVIVKDGQARLENESLAGSVLKMNEAFRNMVHFSGCSVAQAVQMTATNPSKQLKIADEKGSIAAGKDADLVILDDSYHVVMTICRGEVAYDREVDGQ